MRAAPFVLMEGTMKNSSTGSRQFRYARSAVPLALLGQKRANGYPRQEPEGLRAGIQSWEGEGGSPSAVREGCTLGEPPGPPNIHGATRFAPGGDRND